MHRLFKSITVLISVCVLTTYGLESEIDRHDDSSLIKPHSTDLWDVEGRRRRKDHYFIHPYHGWYALSWIYWVKVKLVVVAFFAYLTFIWAWSYLAAYSKKCQQTGHHAYYNGHYRSLDTPEIPKSLQNIANNRRRRATRKQSHSLL